MNEDLARRNPLENPTRKTSPSRYCEKSSQHSLFKALLSYQIPMRTIKEAKTDNQDAKEFYGIISLIWLMEPKMSISFSKAQILSLWEFKPKR